MSNQTIFIDFFQSVANLPGSKSNSKNIDPKSESSFARFFSNETIFNDFFQSLANFPAKGLLAREAPALARYACLLGAGVLKDPSGNSSFFTVASPN